MRRKPSGESPIATSGPNSGAGRRWSRKGAALRTCDTSVSGEIHFLQSGSGIICVLANLPKNLAKHAEQDRGVAGCDIEAAHEAADFFYRGSGGRRINVPALAKRFDE